MTSPIDPADPPSPPQAPVRALLLNVWGVLALPLVIHAIFLFWSAQSHTLAVRVRCSQPLDLKVDLAGADNEYAEKRQFEVTLPGAAGTQEARLPLPPGRIDAARLHLSARGKAAAIELGDFEILSDAADALGWDGTVRRAPAAHLVPIQQIAGTSLAAAGWLSAAIPAGADDPICVLPFAPPAMLGVNVRAFLFRVGVDLLACGLAGAAAVALWRRNARARSAYARCVAAQGRGLERVERFCRTRPCTAIWLVALAGVLLANYPIVFGGRSLVAPNFSLLLLYNRLPCLPGYADTTPSGNQFSDVAATMTQSVPWAVTQRRTIFRDHELPVWDRYVAGGVPLLGQDLTMIGDPLHWLPLLANSASWAWDLRFLLNKLLFAVGIGLAVRAAARHLPSALLLTFSSCFLSFFVFRLNHSAQIGVCYAPWILCAWLGLAQRGGRCDFGWLLASNWMVLNSGTAKEACILLLAMNASGVLALLVADRVSWAEKGRRLAGAVLAGFCFVLVSAPLWMTFAEALAQSWNNYQEPKAWQIQPGLLIGLFDDVFYRQFNQGWLFNPALNFVVLIGVAFAAVHCKTLVRDRAFAGPAIGALVSLAFVFGVVPPGVIVALPFIANIVHIDTTFTCPAIIFLLVLAGFGFRECWRRFDRADWTLDLLGVTLLLAVLLGGFVGLTQAAHSSVANPKKAIADLQVAPFCWWYAATLIPAFIGLPVLLRQIWRRREATLAGSGVLLALCVATLLWRHGLHTPRLTSKYVMTPGARADLLASSPAVGFLQDRQRAEPGRTMGFDSCLCPGFASLYQLESPSGPNALQNRYYHQLLEGSGIPYQFNWYLAAKRADFAGYRRFYDLLNVRYYLQMPDAGEAPAGLNRLGRFDLDVCESLTAWPRAFFVDAVSSHREPAGIYEQIAKGDGRPFVSFSESEPPPPEVRALPHDAAARTIVPATDYRLTSGSTTFRVHATRPGVIALLEGYLASGVRVLVNGKPTPHFRVDAAFNGIYVPAAGDYLVSFAYRPVCLTLSLWLSAAGVLILVAAAVISRAMLVPPRSAQTPVRAGSGPAAAAATMDAP